MRIPLEYGDNFPVPSGNWNPSVPWRFPRRETLRRPLFLRILPWLTLGLGVTIGLLWMKGRTELPAPVPSQQETVLGQQPVLTPEPNRPARPGRLRSRLA